MLKASEMMICRCVDSFLNECRVTLILNLEFIILIVYNYKQGVFYDGGDL